MLQNPVQIPEKSKKCTDIFAFRVSKRPADKRKVTSEYKSVTVQNIYCFFIFAHAVILTFELYKDNHKDEKKMAAPVKIPLRLQAEQFFS